MRGAIARVSQRRAPLSPNQMCEKLWTLPAHAAACLRFPACRPRAPTPVHLQAYLGHRNIQHTVRYPNSRPRASKIYGATR